MTPSMTLRALPKDIYEILHGLLDLEAIARLYATFDRRVQLMLLNSRPSRQIDIEPTYSSVSWHILYYLRQLKGIDGITLKNDARVSFGGFSLLSSLQPRHLCISRSSLLGTKTPRFPFSYIYKRSDFLSTTKMVKYFDNAVALQMLRIGDIYPSLEGLKLHSDVISTINHMTEKCLDEEEATRLFFDSLPKSLLSLRLEAGISTHSFLEFHKLSLPVSLTDLRLTSTWENYISLYEIVKRLQNIQSLHLNLISNSRFLKVAWCPHKCEYKLPASLKNFGIWLAPSALPLLANELVFPLRTSNIESLHIQSNFAENVDIGALDLRAILPPQLVELTLPLASFGIKASSSLHNFPRTLLYLNLGSCNLTSKIFSDIAALPQLRSLTAQPMGRRDDTLDWSFLPTTLTDLELRDYTMEKNDLLRLPETLLKLRCSVNFFEDAKAFLDRCTLASLHCDSALYLSPPNLAQVFAFSDLETLSTVTSGGLMRRIYAYLGPRARMMIHFASPRSSRSGNSGETLALAPKNESLIIDSNAIYMNGYVLNALHFSISLTSKCLYLTYLEFYSSGEISSLKFLPPNLTALHLRSSPIKNGISIRDVPLSLTSLTALFQPHSSVRVDIVPSTKQFKVLRTPSLAFSCSDIEACCSDELSLLHCKLSWIYDRDVSKWTEKWKAASLSIDLVARVTGALVPNTTRRIDIDSLSKETTLALKALGYVRNVEILAPTSLLLPSSATLVDLVPSNLSVPSNFTGFENDIFPSTLTHLAVHLVRNVKNLFSLLPASVRQLYLSSPRAAIEYIGPYPPHLETLVLACSELPPANGRNVGLPFYYFPRSLTSLKLHHCNLIVHPPHYIDELPEYLRIGPEIEPEALDAPFTELRHMAIPQLSSYLEEKLLRLCPNVEITWLQRLPM